MSGAPLFIGIGGSASGAGKTSFAEKLLRRLRGGGMPLGAIKYTRTGLYTSLIDDPAVLMEKDKDTARLLKAGAEKVLLVRGPAEDAEQRADLEEALMLAAGRLSEMGGVLVEGNTAVELLSPDIVIFIGADVSQKNSALRVLEMADVVLLPPAGAGALPPRRGGSSAVFESPRECLEYCARLIDERKNKSRTPRAGQPGKD